MKEWLSMKEAAYLVGRDVSQISRWKNKGAVRARRNEKGLLEVAREDVVSAEASTSYGRPRSDTP